MPRVSTHDNDKWKVDAINLRNGEQITFPACLPVLETGKLPVFPAVTAVASDRMNHV